MREILFRGKRVDNGEWVEGLLFTYNGNHCIQLEGIGCDDYGLYPRCYAEIITESISEFTSLTDKNGKKIFEGDIVLFEDESPSNYEYHDCTEMRCGEIKFDDGEFCLTNRIAVEMGDLIYNGKLDGEIVGNIHDNPELLKGE
jgi:uncharacterized phage protein (TIGR01671 family)